MLREHPVNILRSEWPRITRHFNKASIIKERSKQTGNKKEYTHIHTHINRRYPEMMIFTYDVRKGLFFFLKKEHIEQELLEIKNDINKNVNKGINDKVEEISQKENKREFPIRRESREKCLELKDKLSD